MVYLEQSPYLHVAGGVKRYWFIPKCTTEMIVFFIVIAFARVLGY